MPTSRKKVAIIHFTAADYKREADLFYPNLQPVIITPESDISEAALSVCKKYCIPITVDNLRYVSATIKRCRFNSLEGAHHSDSFAGAFYSFVYLEQPSTTRNDTIDAEHLAYTQLIHELTHHYLLDYLGIRSLIHSYLDSEFLVAENERISKEIAKRTDQNPTRLEQLLLRLAEICQSQEFADIEPLHKINTIKTNLFRIKLYERFGIDIAPNQRVAFEEEICELVACLATASKYNIAPSPYLESAAGYWFRRNIGIVTDMSKTEARHAFAGRSPPTDLFGTETNSFAWEDWTESVFRIVDYCLHPVLFSASQRIATEPNHFNSSSGERLLDSCIRFIGQTFIPRGDYLETYQSMKSHGLFVSQKPMRLKNAKTFLAESATRPEDFGLSVTAKYIVFTHAKKL